MLIRASSREDFVYLLESYGAKDVNSSNDDSIDGKMIGK